MYLALVAVCLVVTSSYALPPSISLAGCGGQKINATSPVIQNANHIFNAIHSSMRQWGSSLHHNGMSFFEAEIPAGTELYHGREDNITVQGMEWLAFEPEHAMNFARARRSRKPPPADHDEVRRDEMSSQTDPDPADQTQRRHQQLLGINSSKPRRIDEDEPSHGPPHDGAEQVPGWLHTYTMKHDLRVIYIDGEAAAKSQKGTLDTQDYVLAPDSDRDDHEGPGRGPGDEYSRAQQMCDLAANQWQGRVDGFIRMEHGFELILCNFSKSSDLVRMARVSYDYSFRDQEEGVMLLSFLTAIGARYHSIGGERVKVNYEHFVTAFATNIDLFQDDSGLPRLKNITKDQRVGLVDELTGLVLGRKEHKSHKSLRSLTKPSRWRSFIDMIMDRKSHPHKSHRFHSKRKPTNTNYQSNADMIIARYSDALHSFAHDNFSAHNLEYRLTLLLRPFIDYDARNFTLEVETCAGHFLPSMDKHRHSYGQRESVAHTALLAVSHRICSTLFTALSDTSASSSNSQSLSTSQSQFQSLIHWLQWTSHKECRPGCSYGEFCMTAIWPVGNKRSHETPYCVNASSLGEVVARPGDGESYWDEMRPRGDQG